MKISRNYWNSFTPFEDMFKNQMDIYSDLNIILNNGGIFKEDKLKILISDIYFSYQILMNYSNFHHLKKFEEKLNILKYYFFNLNVLNLSVFRSDKYGFTLREKRSIFVAVIETYNMKF